MSQPLRIDRDADGIATLWLEPNPNKLRGGVVVLDAWLIGAIAESVAHLAKEKCTGLLLASTSSRVFVAGADLAEIELLDDSSLHSYLERGAAAFAAISALGVPSVAIIHRAALGGGLELAMHCDLLIGTLPGEGEKPWLIGLPECGLAICPGWGGTQMLPARIDPELAMAATATGVAWKCTEVPAGLFASVLPAGTTVEVMIQAGKRAIHALHAARSGGMAVGGCQSSEQSFAPRSMTPEDAGRMKPALERARKAVPASLHADACFECVQIGCTQGWVAATSHERASLVRLRHTEPARAKLLAFLSK